MLKFLLFCVIFRISSSSPLGEDVRIVGGEDIDISRAPYQVSVIHHGRHSCGGAIIAADVIVTAAHCVYRTYASEYTIRIGSSSSKDGGQVLSVEDLIWHPYFSFAKMDSDVALLFLKEPLNFSESVAPIRLADEDDDIEDGDLTVVTGWGNIREGGSSPTTLQQVEVPIVNQKTCNNSYYPQYTITERMLCAGVPTGGKDACQGDSGGPLVHDGKLAGVVSWGIGCARPSYPGVYARVSALKPWIDTELTYMRIKHVLRSFQTASE